MWPPQQDPQACHSKWYFQKAILSGTLGKPQLLHRLQHFKGSSFAPQQAFWCLLCARPHPWEGWVSSKSDPSQCDGQSQRAGQCTEAIQRLMEGFGAGWGTGCKYKGQGVGT